MGPFIGLSSLSRRRCFNTVDALWCHTIEEFGGEGGNESVVRRVPGGNAVGPSAVLFPNFLQTLESRHRFSHVANVCWYLFTPAHSRGIRDKQSRHPALRDLSILKEQSQLHTCTGTQTLWRKGSKIITWNCITWILQLPVDHNISLGNTSYRSFYSANLVCLMFFVVSVGFVCPLGYFCSGQFLSFWQREEEMISAITEGCHCARTAGEAFTCKEAVMNPVYRWEVTNAE